MRHGGRRQAQSTIPFCKRLITMVIVSPPSRVIPLPNGPNMPKLLINEPLPKWGDPPSNHTTTKVRTRRPLCFLRKRSSFEALLTAANLKIIGSTYLYVVLLYWTRQTVSIPKKKLQMNFRFHLELYISFEPLKVMIFKHSLKKLSNLALQCL